MMLLIFLQVTIKGGNTMTAEQALKIIKEQIIYSNLKIRKGLFNESK